MRSIAQTLTIGRTLKVTLNFCRQIGGQMVKNYNIAGDRVLNCRILQILQVTWKEGRSVLTTNEKKGEVVWSENLEFNNGSSTMVSELCSLVPMIRKSVEHTNPRTSIHDTIPRTSIQIQFHLALVSKIQI